jgi:hypothetical protein
MKSAHEWYMRIRKEAIMACFKVLTVVATGYLRRYL